jgi:hypothetical protein
MNSTTTTDYAEIDTLTVSELIAALSNYLPDTPVYATWEGQIKVIKTSNFTVTDYGLEIDVEYDCDREET